MFKLPARIEPFKKPYQIDECLTVFDRNLCEAVVRHCAKICTRNMGESTTMLEHHAHRLDAADILSEFGLENK